MKSRNYIVHVKESKNGWECQSLSNHLSGTVSEIQEFCNDFSWKEYNLF